MLQEKLARAEEGVNEYLAPFQARRLAAQVEIDEDLDALATHRAPDIVIVKDITVPESVIAHELVHLAQEMLEYFRGFRLLYTLLAEGLAEFVAKELYPDHEVKYPSGYDLITGNRSGVSRLASRVARNNVERVSRGAGLRRFSAQAAPFDTTSASPQSTQAAS